jgi:growth hormone-inducible transmembrane protein
MVEAGVMKSDPLRESISLQLDMINIFIRLVQIFGMQQGKKK